MTQTLGGFSVERATDVARTVDRVKHLLPSLLGGEDGNINLNGPRWVELMEDLDKATNSKTGATEAEFRFLVDDLNSDNRDLSSSTSSEADGKIVNRSVSYSATVGAVMLAIQVGDEWTPVVPTAGRATLVSGVCGCYCIEESEGDIIVDGKKTSSRVVVSLGTLRSTAAEEPNGSTVLPANEHLLDYDSGDGYWSKDISSEILGFDLDGDPATITVTGAYIRWEPTASPDMKLTVHWPNGLVP